MLDRYLVFALLSAVFMASSGIIARFSALSAAELTFYRLAVGACCLALLLLGSGQLRQLRHIPDRMVLLNGILLASFMLCFLQAIETISLANAIMLVYLAPPLTALAAHWLYQEKLSRHSVLLIGLSVFGFAMLQQFQLSLALTPAQLPGFIFGLCSLLAYAAYLLLNRKPAASQSLYQRTFYQLLIGAVCVLPFLTDAQLPATDQLLWIALAGIFPGFLAILTALAALQHLPTRVYGTLAYLEPVTVILAGWWLFAEQLSWLQAGGVLLILSCGVAQAALPRTAPSPAPTAPPAELAAAGAPPQSGSAP